MPVIQPYEAHIPAEGALRVQATPDDFGAQIGAGVQRMGAALGQVNQQAYQLEQQQGELWGMQYAGDMSERVRQQLQQYRQQIDLTSPEGIKAMNGYSDYAATLVNNGINDGINNAPSAAAAKAVARFTLYQRGALMGQAINDQAQMSRAYALDTVTHISNQLTAQMADPATTPEAVNSALAQTDAMVKNLPGLDPENRLQLRDKMQDNVRTSYWYGQAESNPQGLLNALTDGGFVTTKGKLTGAVAVPAGKYDPANLSPDARNLMEQAGNLVNPNAMGTRLYLAATHSIESGGNANAPDSPQKAVGISQIMEGTFKEYALPGHTDIRNPLDNLLAGIHYMQTGYDKAIAAGAKDPNKAAMAWYLGGPGGLADYLAGRPGKKDARGTDYEKYYNIVSPNFSKFGVTGTGAVTPVIDSDQTPAAQSPDDVAVMRNLDPAKYPGWNDLSWQQRRTIVDKAVAQYNRRSTQNLAQVDTDLKNAVTLLQNGKPAEMMGWSDSQFAAKGITGDNLARVRATLDQAKRNGDMSDICQKQSPEACLDAIRDNDPLNRDPQNNPYLSQQESMFSAAASRARSLSDQARREAEQAAAALSTGIRTGLIQQHFSPSDLSAYGYRAQAMADAANALIDVVKTNPDGMPVSAELPLTAYKFRQEWAQIPADRRALLEQQFPALTRFSQGSGPVTPADIAALGQVNKLVGLVHAETTGMAQAKADPAQVAVSANQVPPIDLGNPEAATKNLTDRLTWFKGQQQIGRPAAMLTQAEGKELQERWNNPAMPASQVAMEAGAYMRAMDGNAPAQASFLGALGKQDANLGGVAALAARGDIDGATQVLEGLRRGQGKGDLKLDDAVTLRLNTAFKQFDASGLMTGGNPDDALNWSRANDVVKEGVKGMVWAELSSGKISAADVTKDYIQGKLDRMIGGRVKVNGIDTISTDGIPDKTLAYHLPLQGAQAMLDNGYAPEQAVKAAHQFRYRPTLVPGEYTIWDGENPITRFDTVQDAPGVYSRVATRQPIVVNVKNYNVNEQELFKRIPTADPNYFGHDYNDVGPAMNAGAL